MKNVFDRLVSRRNMAEERISELENMWIETKKLSEKRLGKKKGTDCSTTMGQLQKV